MQKVIVGLSRRVTFLNLSRTLKRFTRSEMAGDGPQPTERPVSILHDIIRCTNFSAIKHQRQRRKDHEQTPYINHPIGVAYWLTQAGITDHEVIMAALLHDTVEDTDTSFEEIEAEFGHRVRCIVEEVTDDKKLPKKQRKELQVEHARVATPDAKVIKLADKLYNLEDLLRSKPYGWTEERVKEYFEWAFRVFEGLRGTNQFLEFKLEEVFKRASAANLFGK